jgi:protein gp37
MAKKNPGDILTCDWNPVIGCERCSPGCAGCWYLDGIFPWQQRLRNIPPDVQPNEHYLFEKRLTEASLKAKHGIVGVVQHGDLFWDKVPDTAILRVLSAVDAMARANEAGRQTRSEATPPRARTKYLLWTKRARRMADILARRYPEGLPPYLAAAVSVEDQATADERLPHLSRVRGTRAIALEPLLGPVDLSRHLPIEWVIVGSETGHGARPIDLDWVRTLRDQSTALGIPFFIKQLGPSHKDQLRQLDGRTWDGFPAGFIK